MNNDYSFLLPTTDLILQKFKDPPLVSFEDIILWYEQTGLLGNHLSIKK